MSLMGVGNTLSGDSSTSGGLAQLGERLHGMQEVTGSIPVISTKKHRIWFRYGAFLFVAYGVMMTIMAYGKGYLPYGG